MKLTTSFGVIALSLSGLSAQAASYSVLDIGDLGGTVVATGLNNLGQVVGYATTANQEQHAFVTGYGGIGMLDLGTLGGTSSAAWAINDSGQVVGGAMIAGNTATHAFVTAAKGTKLNDIGTLGGTNSAAYGINNAGQVAGISDLPPGSKVFKARHAFIADSSGVKDIGMPYDPSLSGGHSATLGSFRLQLAGINASGQIAASSVVDIYLQDERDGVWHASGGGDGFHFSGFIGTADGTWKDLFKPTSLSYTVNGLNDAGQLVGNAVPAVGGDRRAFVTDANGEGRRDLGTLGGWTSDAYDINNLGQIVGGSRTSQTSSVTHAFVTLDGKLTDLNSLVDLSGDTYLTLAKAINDRGQILATDSNGRALLLSPSAVPEASASSMAVAALGCVLLLTSRGRRTAKAQTP